MNDHYSFVSFPMRYNNELLDGIMKILLFLVFLPFSSVDQSFRFSGSMPPKEKGTYLENLFHRIIHSLDSTSSESDVSLSHLVLLLIENDKYNSYGKYFCRVRLKGFPKHFRTYKVRRKRFMETLYHKNKFLDTIHSMNFALRLRWPSISIDIAGLRPVSGKEDF